MITNFLPGFLLLLLVIDPSRGQLGSWVRQSACIHDSGEDPVFKHSGGYAPDMTPYQCIKNCMSQELHQRYDKELVVGLTQGGFCLCGYDYQRKQAAGDIEEYLGTEATSLCNIPCCTGTGGICPTGIFQCGGDYGRVSIYFDFAAPVTVGLNVFLTNSDKQNVAIDYTMGILPPPTPGGTTVGLAGNITITTTATTTTNTTATTTTITTTNTTTNTNTTLNPLTAPSTFPPSINATYLSSVTSEMVVPGYKKLNVFEDMFLNVEIGEYRCSNQPKSPSPNNETLCAISDMMGSQSLPPVIITVDFGDGSGVQKWSREDPRDLWTHKYQLPGQYWIHVSTLNEYDQTGDEIWYEVLVVDPLKTENEVLCPPVVTPGEFFLCTADIPRGSDLTFTLEMTDDLVTSMKTSSGTLKVPDQFIFIPGGPLKTQSWNHTLALNSQGSSFIIQSTYFKFMGNISEIEYVPATTGTFLVDVIYPECPVVRDPAGSWVQTWWCPLTGACEINCLSTLQMQEDWDTEWGPEWGCAKRDFCSLEGMCNYPGTCPVSSTGEFGGESFFPTAPRNFTNATTMTTREVKYNYVVNNTYTIKVVAGELFKLQHLEIKKAVFLDPERQQIRKNHTERSYFEYYMLGIRCPDSGTCATLALEPETDERLVDLAAQYNTTAPGGYVAMTYTEEKRAIRPVMIEDRILAVEQKFFCDRTTEKTVTLTVTDSQNTPMTVKSSTQKLSCEFPVSGVLDLTEKNEKNIQNNTWTYIKTTETNCTDCYSLRDPKTGKLKTRTYLASLWARVGETIRFHVRFTKGSHMIFSWYLNDQTNHVNSDDEYCFADLVGENALAQAEVESQNITWDVGDTVCIFPFRFKNVLYYACTNLTIGGSEVYMCATEVNLDNNPITMSLCTKQCPIQVPRPEETGLTNTTSILKTVVEGQTKFESTFVQSIATEIILDRTFTLPGYTYNLTLKSRNMHDITEDNLIMIWTIYCANPVKPEDWELSYPPQHHFGKMFNITLKVKPNVPLPTRPKIRVYAVIGYPNTASTAMRRWDHAPFISMQLPNYAVKFSIRNDKSEYANKTTAAWFAKQSVLTLADAPPVLYEEYEFRYLGVENPEEQCIPSCTTGVNRAQGTFSKTTNLKAGPSGEIGLGQTGTEYDYREFTLQFPTIKYPGSYAFTVVMWNGVSDLRYSSSWNLSQPEYYPADMSLLLPGGPGYIHKSGKDEEYCLQFPNKTEILNANGSTTCYSGHDIEIVEKSLHKWNLNWVEIFQKLETPFEGELSYVLPEEAPNDIVLLDFVKPKFYMPAQAHPNFKLSIYRGTPRKIAYSFNSTEVGGYNPEFCYIDWPPGNLMDPCIYKTCPDQDAAYAGFTQKLSWNIHHCSNVSEGIYNVQLGAWNILDGWIWLDKPFLVEVLEQIGPIFIDDFNIINDYNETKEFNIRFGKMGRKTCVTIDWGDGSKLNYYGNPLSCKQRYTDITEDMVKAIDYVGKQFYEEHVYNVRGLFEVTVTGFDERSFAEKILPVTIFRMPCKVPKVWLPVNETSWLRPERVPKVFRSKSYQVASMTILECNVTIVPIMEWKVFSVAIKKDPSSQTGLIEELTEIQINDTVPTYQSSVIEIPPNILEFGLYKLVFKLDIPTGVPDLPLFRQAHTYFNITKSPLAPGFIKGSVSKVTRGWGQTVTLDGKEFSIDPDYPDDKNFNYTWFCRNEIEEWNAIFQFDSDFNNIDEDFPLFIPSQAQRIPKPGDPAIMLPEPNSGCFGMGPGGMRWTSNKLVFNTSSLLTYAQVYEVALIVSKDYRIAQTSIKIDVGVLPAPVVEISCASEGLCTPTLGGIFVNPTSRLAFRSNCIEQCEGGKLSYNWNIKLDTAKYPFRLKTVSCDPDLTTTTTTTTSTTTTTVITTTTLPPILKIESSTFITADNLPVMATEAADGSYVIVTFGDFTARKKRQISFTLGEGSQSVEELGFVGPQQLIPDKIDVGCSSVFTTGISKSEFSITTDFFKMNPTIKSFSLELNITRCIDNGRKVSCSSGVSTLNIIINDPPYKGVCTVANLGVTEENNPSAPGFNTALLDIFHLKCSGWSDPNKQSIKKYVFKITKTTARGNETSLLYSGPLDNTKAVFGYGKFYLIAEIWDEAGAFATYVIDPAFPTILPTRAAYEAFPYDEEIKKYQDTGDTSRTAMLLQAESSVRQSANWFSIENMAGDVSRANMSIAAGQQYDALLRDLTNSNTKMIEIAADTLEFNSIESLDQGSSTLYTITSQLVKGGDISKTLDMKGREAAVKLIDKMNTGFQKLQISDPNKLKSFIEGTTGSILAILTSLNTVLYSNDPADLPLTDLDAAASLPYDTDIPDGDADIPDDKAVAFQLNTMRVTRMNSVAQVKVMVDLVDDMAKKAITSQVVGEVMDTKAPLGVAIKLAKVSGANTIGKDMNGDGIPDKPLVYTFKESETRVEFPLNFCPGKLFEWVEGSGDDRVRKSSLHMTPNQITFPCIGTWGIAIKEWQVIKQAYPVSAQNLNRLTKTIDVDIYDENSDKVDVKLPSNVSIKITIGRMKEKDNTGLGILAMPTAVNINVTDNLETINKRKRLPILYHQVEVDKSYATVNFQIKGFNVFSNLAVMAKFGSMMVDNDCDFIQRINDVKKRDGEWVDWFIGVDQIQNRTGDWYFGVVALANDVPDTVSVNKSCSDLTKSHLLPNFNTSEYTIRIYIGGCYYFNVSTEAWEGTGVEVEGKGDNTISYCKTNHLTSFGTGFFTAPNTIDFEFVFTEFDLQDNVTIFMVILVTIIFFLIILIWAILKDKKDIKDQEPHWMNDNLPQDHYIYEILVQTGPMLSHGTESKVQFILTGEEDETQIRTLSDPSKQFFKKGSLDTFVMTTDRSLGNLQYIKIWHDNSGIREMQPWYLAYIIIYDIQTGEKYRFLADRWLAIDRDEFTSEIQVPVSLVDGEADVSFLFRTGLFNILKDDHVWWSVFSRPIRSRFTRTQRACVSMATLYLALLTNAMWYGVNDAYVGTSFGNIANIFSLTSSEIQIGVFSNIIIFVPAIIMIMLFRKAGALSKGKNRIDKTIERAAAEGKIVLPEKTYHRTKEEEDEKKTGDWPSYCYFIAWIFTVLFILGGMGMVAMYGLQFGNEKTYGWFTAITINFFWNVFVESPIKVLIVAGFIALVRRKPNWNQDHLDADQELPTIYFDPEAIDNARPSKPKAEVPEFDPAYLEPLRFRRVQEGEMNATIQEILVYLVYLVIVIAVANGNRNPNSFYMKDMLATTVVHGGLLCSRPDGIPCDPDEDLKVFHNPYLPGEHEVPFSFVDFMQVREVNQFWMWFNATLIPNVRVQSWYNDDPPYGLRGYLDDRVNRLIGYAVVRQVREKIGNCRAPPQMRDYVESCTGDLEIPLLEEDDRTYCLGWKPVIAEDCVRMREFQYISETKREASATKGVYRSYSGGGYELKMKGSIGELKDKIEVLQNSSWIDNRTRAVMVEFSVFNAQVNQFGVVRILAEFVGGGLIPTYRIDVITLTKTYDFGGYITAIAELLFVISTFYYLLNVILTLKSMGLRDYFKESWNVVDILTITVSILTIGIWGIKYIRVAVFTQQIAKTGGNDYVPIDSAQSINLIYDYLCSLTVFTSMLKLCRLLSFQKAFRQIAATIKLCFIGLSTFIVEFIIVFGSFCCFFFFMLSAYLSNFRDMLRTVENTLAMAIGKFNFASLKEASEMAAWIFFAFSIVVNMILINMMMAIINMAFEEIKNEKEAFQNKFEIIEYIKRSIKELTGVRPAQRDLPVFKIDKPEEDGEVIPEIIEEDLDNGEKPISVEFSDKTNQLLEYIEKTYLSGFPPQDGQKILEKMRLAENTNKAKVMVYGFDNIFGEGPTPTPSMLGGVGEEDEEVDMENMDLINFDSQSLYSNASNVDGMNI